MAKMFWQLRAWGLCLFYSHTELSCDGRRALDVDDDGIRLSVTLCTRYAIALSLFVSHYASSGGLQIWRCHRLRNARNYRFCFFIICPTHCFYQLHSQRLCVRLMPLRPQMRRITAWYLTSGRVTVRITLCGDGDEAEKNAMILNLSNYVLHSISHRSHEISLRKMWNN